MIVEKEDLEEEDLEEENVRQERSTDNNNASIEQNGNKYVSNTNIN